MRKIAPAFIATAIVALASGSAFAGDSAKHSTTTSTDATTPSTSMSSDTTADSKKKLKQTARNDMKCDQSKLAPGATLPKDCLEKSGTGAAAVGSTQGQSGGSSGGSGAGAGGSGSGSGGSSQ